MSQRKPVLAVDATGKLQVGKRYLLKEVHVDGDTLFEATVEELSTASEEAAKLRLIPQGSFEWKETWRLQIVEELPPLTTSSSS